MSEAALHSVVVPVFNEVEGIERFHERCDAAMTAIGDPFEIIYVDDGSSDGSWAALSVIAAADPRVRLVRLSRNFGHQVAITAGIECAVGTTVTVIDADLQDPPELIAELLARWRAGADVVYAVRTRRSGEKRFKLATAAAFYRLMRWLADIEMPVDAGDFRLLSRLAVEALLSMPERDRFVRGMFAWIGFETAVVTYERDARVAGASKYPLAKMVRFALDGLLGFSMRPLRLATWLGLIVSAGAFVLAVVLIVARLLGHIPVQGWTSLAVLVLLVGGVQLVTVGALGEYVGRIYNEVRGRPLYLVRERRGFEPADDGPAASGPPARDTVATPRLTSRER
jgi:dolichol-phosphate mannosyltransferase